jgi:hypothetical protein
VGALSWQPILVAAATAAGGAAWVASVGSTVIAVRLENAHLPAASVVALMSAEHRFAIGASYLIAPLFVGFVGFLADWAVTTGKATRRPRTRIALAVAIIAVATLIGLELLRPPLETLFIAQNAATLLIVLTIWALTPQRGRRVEERLLVFVLVMLLAGVLAFLFERRSTPVFDFAAVAMKADGEPVAGYYVTTTGSALLLITVPNSRQPACSTAVAKSDPFRIVAVPADSIDRTLIGPAQRKVTPELYCELEGPALASVKR